MSRNRNYCFTLNNYTKEDTDMIKGCDLFTYIIFGEEVAPTTGTKHLQGYFEMKEAKTISALVKKHLPKGIHLEAAKGNATHNKTYCSKGQNIFEKGEPKTQGKRVDLIELKNDINQGKKVDDICMENPEIYHQYGRTLSKIEDITLRKKFRNWKTTCNWYYGPADVDKGEIAFDNFNPETHYVFPYDGNWWDGYTGQENVIIHNFKGQIPYHRIVDLVDRIPITVSRRGREPMPFLAKNIIITSTQPPRKIFTESGIWDDLTHKINLYKKLKKNDLWCPMNGLNTKEEKEEYYNLYQEFKGEL